jgi:endonuclease-3 related protein
MAIRRRYRVTSMSIPAPELASPSRVHRTADPRAGLLVGATPKGLLPGKMLAAGRPPLDEYYNSLFTALGPQHWWPGRTQFEVIVGAILTQNTSWKNVERAILRLREDRLLSPRALGTVPLHRLERLIRSSGYFRQKARKLKAFCEFLRTQYGGSLKRMFETPTIVLREKLLGVFGIGPETADSILLYAGDHSVFVVDAYTKRLLVRHGWAGENAKYEDVRWMFEREFPGDVKRFNEFHALIVNTGKNFCRAHDPVCHQCPLGRYLEEGR